MHSAKLVNLKRKVMAKPGLYANIHAKRKRGGKMRKPGSPGAPTAQDFKDAAKTAKRNKLKIKK